MATERYIWGGVDENAIRLDQEDPITNAKLNQNSDHFTERIDLEAALAKYFAEDEDNTAGLVWAYFGGKVRNGSTVTNKAAGTVNLAASATNYVEIDPATTAVSANTAGFTLTRIPLRLLTTDASSIITNVDARTWAFAGGGGSVTAVTGSNGITSSGGTTPDIFITAGGVTDTHLGNRTADESTSHSSLTGTLTQLLSLLFKQIKAITGKSSALTAPATTLEAAATHMASTANPHNVTKAQVGLGNVDNTSDDDKPVSTATQTALNGKANTSHNHSGADITSGTVAADRLGSGAAGDGTKVLYDNNTWAVPPGAGGGEANTASNLGSSGDGEGLYDSKSGVDLRFKRLKAGANITLTPTSNSIEIAASGGGGSAALDEQLVMFSQIFS